MHSQNLSLPKTLNPPFSPSPWEKLSNPLRKTLIPTPPPKTPKPFSVKSLLNSYPIPIALPAPTHAHRLSVRSFAGRSKKKPGGSSGGRIEGGAEFRREAKRKSRMKSKKLAESLFYRLKNPNSNYPSNFSERELQMIGLGYDRLVRFMDKDDPNLRHPYDWYKYGEFGPYSWRGVVVGDPIRGGITDECVTMIGTVKDQEEWEKIEQFEMATEFGQRLKKLDPSVGLRHFWVFVRHPRWRISELPWQQWTLVSEVVLEAGKQRLDKWNLMGRLGNQTRAMITQCAAWMRPDILYVKRPVFQCRFEPQDNFFRSMVPLLDPETEQDFQFELEVDDGRFELSTYFGGLCKLVRVNQKAFVDDVVKAYEKLSDERKSKVLEFLFTNHPIELLHPYTKEWKVKLEEAELGCDAPEDENGSDENQFVDWIEDDEENNDDVDDDDDDNSDDDDDDDHDDVRAGEDNDDNLDDTTVLDMEEDGDEELGIKGEPESEEEDENYWDEEFKKAFQTNEGMEKLVARSMKVSNKVYEKHLSAMGEGQGVEKSGQQSADVSNEVYNIRSKATEERGTEDRSAKDGDELALRGRRAKVSRREWKQAGYGPWRKRIKKSKIPPALFLKAAVRPFTYRNLVKEIVLTRHAIVEGEIGLRKH